MLVIGKRYWLDSLRDVSGVFLGREGHYRGQDRTGLFFDKIEGKNPYQFFPGTAVVGFWSALENTFYEV